MYTLLCKTIDDVIEPLSRIPGGEPYAESLQDALLQAEEIYISTAPYVEETPDTKIFQIKIDIPQK